MSVEVVLQLIGLAPWNEERPPLRSEVGALSLARRRVLRASQNVASARTSVPIAVHVSGDHAASTARTLHPGGPEGGVELSPRGRAVPRVAQLDR
jgi:hypothetical protein